MKSNAFNLIESLNINEILDLQYLFHGRFDYLLRWKRNGIFSRTIKNNATLPHIITAFLTKIVFVQKNQGVGTGNRLLISYLQYLFNKAASTIGTKIWIITRYSS